MMGPAKRTRHFHIHAHPPIKLLIRTKNIQVRNFRLLQTLYHPPRLIIPRHPPLRMREAHLLCRLRGWEECIGRIGVFVGDWVEGVGLEEGVRACLAGAVFDFFV
jgi:hypothetical protein